LRTPPPVPPIPVGPAAKPPIDPSDLPPLTLPPDGPPTTSRASPLAAVRKSGPTVQVFPAVATTAPTNGTRNVGFFNHTNTDVDLVIEGKSVKLPKKTYLHAAVPPTFTWKHGTNPAESATVPAGAAGIDVVFRDQ
jgi:hypothetical protein